MAPLIRLLTNIKSKKINITIIIGSKTKTEIFFIDLINEILKNKKHML